MTGKLILTRKGSMLNHRQHYTILIDGKEVGQIKNDDTEEIELLVGVHDIQCKINWMSSPVKQVTIKDGDKTFLQVSSGMKFIVPLYFMMLAGLFFPFYFRFAKLPIPEAATIIKLVLIIPALLYYIFYISINRKNYLHLGEDKSNPFS